MTQIPNKTCLRASAIVIAVLQVCLAVVFLYMSFVANDDKFLKLIGQKPNLVEENARFDQKMQYIFISIAFFIIIVASLGISAAYSNEKCITYFYGYSNLLMSMVFGAVGVTVAVLAGRIESDFGKECHSNTGMAFQIDHIYSQGANIMCTDKCKCALKNPEKYNQELRTIQQTPIQSLSQIEMPPTVSIVDQVIGPAPVLSLVQISSNTNNKQITTEQEESTGDGKKDDEWAGPTSINQLAQTSENSSPEVNEQVDIIMSEVQQKTDAQIEKAQNEINKTVTKAENKIDAKTNEAVKQVEKVEAKVEAKIDQTNEKADQILKVIEGEDLQKLKEDNVSDSKDKPTTVIQDSTVKNDKNTQNHKKSGIETQKKDKVIEDADKDTVEKETPSNKPTKTGKQTNKLEQKDNIPVDNVEQPKESVSTASKESVPKQQGAKDESNSSDLKTKKEENSDKVTISDELEKPKEVSNVDTQSRSNENASKKNGPSSQEESGIGENQDEDLGATEQQSATVAPAKVKKETSGSDSLREKEATVSGPISGNQVPTVSQDKEEGTPAVVSVKDKETPDVTVVKDSETPNNVPAPVKAVDPVTLTGNEQNKSKLPSQPIDNGNQEILLVKNESPTSKPGVTISPTDGYINYLECPTETLSKQHEYKFAQFLATMETTAQCAGICELPKYYLFSDINNGPPQKLCKDHIIDYVHDHAANYILFTLLVSLMGFVGLGFAFTIEYHKKNKLQNSWSKYQSMKFN